MCPARFVHLISNDKIEGFYEVNILKSSGPGLFLKWKMEMLIIWDTKCVQDLILPHLPFPKYSFDSFYFDFVQKITE